MSTPAHVPWWRDAVVHQVYVRSFADSDGDGVGDLPGITARLDSLVELGVDAVWLTPFYASPQHDHGYDVADYLAVDPLFGTMDDARALLARARELGLRVIVDVVPNHTSVEHAWFVEALAAPPGSPARERYLFRTGRDGGESPPNNWGSMFGGPAWTRVPGEDQWYLHLFDSSQPDLDWRHRDVAPMFLEVLRFWLDAGVDGFRIDVAHALFKEESLRDALPHDPALVVQDQPMFDQPEVHEVYRTWRELLDSYPGDRMAVAEAWTQTPEAMARYLRPDELHQSFNFAWLYAEWSAESFAQVVTSTMTALEAVGASPTWVLNNHDVVRHVTRYGGGDQGLRRALAATTVMLALPGSAYLYQGEELGLAEVEVSDADRQDPAWFRMGIGRDGCRVPVPWSGTEPPYGFSPRPGQPWLPQPDDWAGLTHEAQVGDPGSTWSAHQRLLAARRRHALPAPREVSVEVPEPGLLQIRRGDLLVLLNTGSAPVPLPAGRVPVAASGDLLPGDAGSELLLPVDTAVWLA